MTSPDVPPQVLVVEDDDVLRAIIVRLLGQAGYGTTEARGGAEALEQLRTRTPDLMITDNRMPGMSGDALITAARVRLPDLAILRISGADTLPGESRAVPSLQKPFTPEGLLAAVRRALPPA